MGFMDKVKTAAQDVARETKKAAAGTQEKIEQAQTKKKMNDAAEKLGWLVYRERTQGTPAGTEADTLVDEIKSLEASLEAPPPEPPPSDPPPPSA